MTLDDEWGFSDHALDRALDMALSAEEIRETLRSPHVITPSGPGYPDEYQQWARGRICLIVNPEDRAVVTCLWRGKEYVRGTDSEPFRDSP